MRGGMAVLWNEGPIYLPQAKLQSMVLARNVALLAPVSLHLA